MKDRISILILLLSSPTFGYAQSRCAAPSASCLAPAPMQLQMPQQAAMPAASGMYIQPPASGTFSGESTSAGFGGLRFTLPSISLELPSIELPGRYSIRRPAQMRVQESIAPFMIAPAAMPVGQVPMNQLYQLRQPVAQPFQQPGAPASVPLNPGCDVPQPASASSAPGCMTENVRPTPPADTTLLREQIERRDRENEMLWRRLSKLEELVASRSSLGLEVATEQQSRSASESVESVVHVGHQSAPLLPVHDSTEKTSLAVGAQMREQIVSPSDDGQREIEPHVKRSFMSRFTGIFKRNR
jgi:hypothetical protein